MNIEKCIVVSNKEIADKIYLIKVRSKIISPLIKPGQFCNIKVSETDFPLLRRPFSICDVVDKNLYFMYKVMGEGTKILSQKVQGEKLDILGPLGNSFSVNEDTELGVIVAGGIGVAPFPYFIKNYINNLQFLTLFGARSKNELIKYGILNTQLATDDGTAGIKGTVIDLLHNNLDLIKSKRSKIFSCGPNPMFRALKEFCIKNDIDCEVSTESAMACGFGICQGCPIETHNEEKYSLICKDGPVFNIRDIEI